MPSTQKCLCYVKRKRTLFSAGTDGAVFAWLIDKIFQSDLFEDNIDKGDKKELEYRMFTCENTPWFLGSIASCIVDLPNIEQIATGSYRKRIDLWELRTENSNDMPASHDEGVSNKNSLAIKTNQS